jgi:ABC-type sulfate transport system permease subunit
VITLEYGGNAMHKKRFALVIISLAVLIIPMWKVYAKAGRPGWYSLIPFFNVYVLLKMASKPGWWLILFFIPIVNVIIAIPAALGLGRNFGKGGGFAIGLILLPIIFYPILAFGDAQFSGPRD